ncbi:N-acetylmuramoyl-L-alanine amidase [Viridibacillus arvi]|uniref:N-acetylmuramoyl-L-alanine amidase n=1 Tax=Viridibacillus arvi TaxID=263475 RepID=UPI003D02EB77
MVKIFIDPGHGGSDPGAIGNGIQEKDITLKIGTKIRDILTAEYNNVSILMSRTGDSFPSLTDRTNAANAWGADFFLSVHINAGGGTGFESYVYPGVGAPSTTYQNNIHSEIMQVNQLTDRGKKQSDLHVLRESNMPALLTENGFIDTVSDATKMKNDTWIANVARGHVNGLVKCFNLPKKDSATYHTVVSGDTVYSMSVKYGSTVDQIKTWNNLNSNYTIYLGQVLRVK